MRFLAFLMLAVFANLPIALLYALICFVAED